MRRMKRELRELHELPLPKIDPTKFVTEAILYGVIVYTYTGIDGAKEVRDAIKKLYPKATVCRVVRMKLTANHVDEIQELTND